MMFKFFFNPQHLLSIHIVAKEQNGYDLKIQGKIKVLSSFWHLL